MDTLLGGNKSLPPPELSLYTWVEDATKAVKSKYCDAVLKEVTAKKVYGGQRKNYDLAFSGKFRFQNSNVVTVSGDGNTIGKPSKMPLGLADVKDLSQVTAKVYALVGPDSVIGNIQYYEEFILFRWIYNSQDYPAFPDQPYYEFRDKNGGRLAIVGASDEKIYTVNTT